jgi:probable HAF family extracellular repeat protein
MTRLPDFGGAYSSAADINDLGQIVGWANTAINDGSHAFLYSGGTLMDLGTLGGNESSATAINNRGEVVGSAEIKGSSYAGHAFLYAKRKMTDLGTLGGSNSSASSINDHGEIVGSSDVKKSRFPHAFIVSNGKMTDLNDLVSSNSKWVVQRAYRISNNGLIVGSGTLKGSYLSQALLLSPVPTLTILGGEKHTTGSHRIKIHGKVDASVAAVTYQQAGHHGTASGPLTRWHIVVSLHPGRNVITVTARGIGGNKISKKITIVRS